MNDLPVLLVRHIVCKSLEIIQTCQGRLPALKVKGYMIICLKIHKHMIQHALHNLNVHFAKGGARSLLTHIGIEAVLTAQIAC
ncbi:hypothetical protein D1872_271380 [compost metagenome]